MKTLNRRNRAFRNLITWDTDREELEERLVPATITVVNTNDSGPGSLRESISIASTITGDDVVTFDAKVFSENKTIVLNTALTVNDISGNTTIIGPAILHAANNKTSLNVWNFNVIMDSSFSLCTV